MYSSEIFSGLITVLVVFAILFAIVPLGCWFIIDEVFIDHSIESTKLIIPELKLVVKDNVIDTLFIYKRP